VLIAEDDFIIREGMLRSLLEPDYAIVASVDDGYTAVAAALEHKPMIALLDISLPRLRGLEAAKQILAATPACRVLLVSNYADGAYSEAAKEMGAAGYVLKSRVMTELLPAIELALAGAFYKSNF
jgi:two-component system response regulator DesR